KFIAALLEHSLRVDLEQLRRYLVNGYRSLYKTGKTFFEGISEVAAGTSLRFDSEGRETSTRYWSWQAGEVSDMPYDEAVRGASEHLTRSVSLRLRADVPLAFCLRGGIDSNALGAIAAKAC